MQTLRKDNQWHNHLIDAGFEYEEVSVNEDYSTFSKKAELYTGYGVSISRSPNEKNYTVFKTHRVIKNKLRKLKNPVLFCITAAENEKDKADTFIKRLKKLA